MRDTLVHSSVSQRSKTAASPNTRRVFNALTPSPPPIAYTPQDDHRYDTDTSSELDMSGSGELVIDLDAGSQESEGVEQDQGGKGVSTLTTGEERTKMSNSVKHQAIVAKGLKMKIKRTRGGESGGSAQKGGELPSAMVPTSTPRFGTLTEAKQVNGLSDKCSKSSSNRNNRKVKDRYTKSQDINSSGIVSNNSNTLNVSTTMSTTGSTPTINPGSSSVSTSLNQVNLAAGLTETVSVELNRIPSVQYSNPNTLVKRESTQSIPTLLPSAAEKTGDPYDFNVRMDDVKQINFQNKKCKMEKVIII